MTRHRALDSFPGWSHHRTFHQFRHFCLEDDVEGNGNLQPPAHELFPPKASLFLRSGLDPEIFLIAIPTKLSDRDSVHAAWTDTRLYYHIQCPGPPSVEASDGLIYGDYLLPAEMTASDDLPVSVRSKMPSQTGPKKGSDIMLCISVMHSWMRWAHSLFVVDDCQPIPSHLFCPYLRESLAYGSDPLRTWNTGPSFATMIGQFSSC